MIGDRKKRVLIVGGGGHASDILSVYEALNSRAVVGYLDDTGPTKLQRRSRYRGILSDLTDIRHTHLMLGIGWPEGRKALWERFRFANFDTAIHPSSSIPKYVVVGEGVVALANAVCSEGVILGRHVYLSNGALVGHDAQIGDFCSLLPGSAVSGDVVIGEGVTVGTNASIVGGLIIGAGATIGAGAVVTRDVVPGMTVVGSPARPIPHQPKAA